jgi:class 3 adenylate cyclase
VARLRRGLLDIHDWKLDGCRVPELSSGTVTLLFTDIEGSTRLIEELGESGYVDALSEHRRLLRTAFATHGGVEVDTQGDAFLFAFSEPG